MQMKLMVVALVGQNLSSLVTFRRVHEDAVADFQFSPIGRAILPRPSCGVWCGKNTQCEGWSWNNLTMECSLYSSLNVMASSPSNTTAIQIHSREPPTKMPVAWVCSSSSTGLCYFSIPHNGSWTEAQALCRASDAVLGFINNKEIMKSISEESGVYGFYVGLSRGNTTAEWHNEDGVELNRTSIVWSTKTGNQPRPTQNCAGFWSALASTHCYTYREINAFCMLPGQSSTD